MNERIVALSAGHHPAAPGAAAVDTVNGRVLTTENREAVLYVAELEAMFEDASIPCRRVPALPLHQKIAVANQRPEVACAIEIHFNAAVNAHGEQIGQGSEVLYCPGSKPSEELARKVEGALGPVFGVRRGVKPGWYRMDAPGRVDYPGDMEGDEIIDAWLRQTHCPAIIVEPEFIHHVYRIRSLRTAACRAILAGVQEWLDR